jgi:hypothetical protein
MALKSGTEAISKGMLLLKESLNFDKKGRKA